MAYPNTNQLVLKGLQMKTIAVPQPLFTSPVFEGDIQYPGSKQVKLDNGSSDAETESNEQDLFCAKHINEFPQLETRLIDSNTETKATGAKNSCRSASELLRYRAKEYGLELYSVNTSSDVRSEESKNDHISDASDLIFPLPIEKYLEQIKFNSNKGVSIPGIVKNDTHAADMLLVGFEAKVRKDNIQNGTTKENEDFLANMIPSSTTTTECMNNQKKNISDKTLCLTYIADKMLTCESVKPEEFVITCKCTASTEDKACVVQDESKQVDYEKHTIPKYSQKTELNSIPATNSRNIIYAEHLNSVLNHSAAPRETKTNEIQSSAKIFDQIEVPTWDLGVNAKPEEVLQSSYLLDSVSFNETKVDSQKMAIESLEHTSSENSPRVVNEKIPVISRNEKAVIVNVCCHGDNDVTVNEESNRNQNTNRKGACIDDHEAQMADKPLYVNTVIGICRFLNDKCDSGGNTKEVAELICMGTSDADKDESMCAKQAGISASAIQLQLSEEKQVEVMQELLKISNDKSRFTDIESVSSNGIECFGNSPVKAIEQTKLVMSDTTTVTHKNDPEKNNESSCDILQHLYSQNSTEVGTLSTLPIIDLTSEHPVQFNIQKHQSKCVLINSGELLEEVPQIISICEPSENLNLCSTQRAKNSSSENEEEHDLKCITSSNSLLVKKCNVIPQYEYAMQTESTTKLEQTSISSCTTKNCIELNSSNNSVCVFLPSREEITILSENVSNQKLNSTLGSCEEIRATISEKEAKRQLKCVSIPSCDKDICCDVHTEISGFHIIPHIDTDNRDRSNANSKDKRAQLSIIHSSMSAVSPINASRQSLGKEILGRQCNNMSCTAFKTGNITETEIPISVSDKLKMQTSTICNVLEDKVHDFSENEAKYLKCVTSSSNLNYINHDGQNLGFSIVHATPWVQDNNEERSAIECMDETAQVSSFCMRSEGNTPLNYTPNITLCHQNEHYATVDVLSVENITDGNKIVASENDRQKSATSLRNNTRTEISERKPEYQQKCVNGPYCIKEAYGDIHPVNISDVIPHFDTDNRSGHRDDGIDKPSQTSCFNSSKMETVVLTCPTNNSLHNHKNEVLVEKHSSKPESTTLNAENNTEKQITILASENVDNQTSFICNVTKDHAVNGVNVFSEKEGECKFKCVTCPSCLGDTNNKVQKVGVKGLHSSPWFQGNNLQIKSADRKSTFCSCCSLTKNNNSLRCNTIMPLCHQNVLEKCSIHDIQSTMNITENNTRNIFSENINGQKSDPFLKSYMRIGIYDILKKKTECQQKCVNSPGCIRDSKVFTEKIIPQVLPHFHIDYRDKPQSDCSDQQPQSSFFSSVAKETILSSENTSLIHDGDVLDGNHGSKMLMTSFNTENSTDENNRICVSDHSSAQTSGVCKVIKNTDEGNSLQNDQKPVKGPGCLINTSDDRHNGLVNAFKGEHQFETSNRYLSQTKCIGKTMECSNICGVLKDCSALNSTINTSQNDEMIEDLEGCSDNETAADNFSTATNTKEETTHIVSDIETNKTLFFLMKEKESSQPEMKANVISIAISSKGSGFDNFEKFTLYPDSEEQDTVTHIQDVNSSNRPINAKKQSSNAQSINDNDVKSNSVCLAFTLSTPHISNLETESVECGYSNKNNTAKEAYRAVTSQKDKVCSDFLSGLRGRPKEENNMVCIQPTQSLISHNILIREADQLQCSVDYDQMCNESNLYGNEKKRKELSYDIVNTFQNNLTHDTHKEVLIQSNQSNSSCTDNLSVQMGQRNKKQKSKENCIPTLITSIDPSVQNIQQKRFPINDDTAESDLTKISLILKEDRKPLELPGIPIQLECTRDVSITQDTQKPLHPEGTKQLLKQIDSATGTNMFTVDLRQSNGELFAPANKNAHFVMKEQFNAVLEELRLFHEISRQSEWRVSVTEETATETSNMKDSHELQSKHDEAHYLCVDSKCDDLQHLIPSHGNVLTPNDHDCYLIEQDTLEYTPSLLVMRDVKGEQEVPIEADLSETEREDSFYSPSNDSEYKKHESQEVKTWSTVFDYKTKYEKTVVDVPSKTGPYVSHGLMKIEPLKTCAGPIRIGLSKRSKPKQLHPYLR